MASKSIRQLREDVTARILTLTGWRESRVAPDNFGRDPNSIGHKAFAVHPTETSDMRAYRGRPAEGLLVETALIVHYSWQLKPTKGMSDSYDDAIDGEQAVVNVLMAYDTTWPLSYKVQVTRTTRTTSDSGEWVLGQVECRIIHTLPLQ
jgi:hypothetical protein